MLTEKDISLQYVSPHWYMGCDQNCSFCYLGKIKSPKIESLENRKKVLDILAENKTEQIFIAGGNPVLDPFIEDTLDYAKSKNILTALDSNSWDVSRIKDLPKFMDNIDDKGISLYGSDAESHDPLSTSPGSFDRAIANAAKLSERGISFTLLFNVMPQNKDKLYEHLKKLRNKINYNKIWMQRIMPYGEAVKTDYSDLELQPGDIIPVLEQLQRAKNDFGLSEVDWTMPAPLCLMPDKYKDVFDGNFLRGINFFALDNESRLFGESFDVSKPEVALFGGRPLYEIENPVAEIKAEPRTAELFARKFLPIKCRECGKCFGGYPIRDNLGARVADRMLKGVCR
ncbi:MAG: radical SAM protein [Rickettsiales bacterium]|jgi:MoaA/NifB/PqqE/SkfB family radical SAM enzyme|nr:radical SAM protein [Rickettsiales bacterium]